MNGLGRDNKENKEKSLIFTKETCGVVLALFSALCLVCLITRETVFSEIGRVVNAFLFGCFGFFAYAVFISLFGLGVLLVSGKKINLSKKRKALITVASFALVLILQLVTVDAVSLEFGEYLSLCYGMGEKGISSASAGGLFAGIISYFLCTLLTGVGSYVILGLVIALITFAFVKDFMDQDNKEKRKDRQKFRSSYVKDSIVEQGQTEENVTSEEQTLEDGNNSNQFAQTATPKARQKLFINNPEEFSFKNKREIQKDANVSPLKLEFSQGGLNVVHTQTAKENTIKKDDDYKKKIDYIKTPSVIDMEKYTSNSYQTSSFSVPPTSATTVSSYISPSKVEDKPLNSNNDIPFIEHNNDSSEKTNQDSAEARAEAFGERYLDINDNQINSTFNQPIIEEQPTEVDSSNDNASEQIFPSPNLSETEPKEELSSSRTSRFDFARLDNIGVEENPPMIEEEPEIVDFSLDNDSISDDSAFEEEIEEEKPAPTNIRANDRLRDIFSKPEENAESVAFTSRVAQDNNLSSRRSIMFEEKKEIEKPIEEKPKAPINREYFRPPFDLLESYAQPFNAEQENHEERMEIIKRTLEEFRIDAVPQGFVQGPSITRYEIMMPAGISVKNVLKYDDDLKMRLSAKNGVRIEAPIPGKNLVGIEVANNIKVTVGLKEVMEGLVGKKEKAGSLMFALGKDIVGNAISDDLTKGPHYLIAGATGSGKSVCLHVMLVSLLMRYSPEELKLVLVDPKCVEFRKYEHLPHLLVDEIVTEPKRALSLLQWAYDETNRRNEMFTACGGHISNIDDYNSMIANDKIARLPRIVFVIDELADLMEACKKDLETRIRMIAAKSRSAGIHLVLATQRPSVDVVTGTIKANLPSRIALKVMNFADSQTILAGGGAEKLLGNGDMLYKNSSMGDYERYQGAYISGREISNIVEYIKEKNTAYFDEEIMQFLDKETRPQPEESSSSEEGGANEEFNDFFLKALWFAVKTGTISISSLQRRFSIGYPRAGSIFDKMEQKGFISPNEGGKARRVLLTPEEYEQRFGPGVEDY
ncbi:MAG: DNA translocase FtsK [Clostridiales bacterium]|nr:DNA translocase FtsK [Clostridiales bacterium]